MPHDIRYDIRSFDIQILSDQPSGQTGRVLTITADAKFQDMLETLKQFPQWDKLVRKGPYLGGHYGWHFNESLGNSPTISDALTKLNGDRDPYANQLASELMAASSLYYQGLE